MAVTFDRCDSLRFLYLHYILVNVNVLRSFSRYLIVLVSSILQS